MGLVMLLVPATSQASTIPYDCGTCGSRNTAFDITYTLIDGVAHTYEVTVTALYEPVVPGAPNYAFINAIAMKFDGLSYDTPLLTSEPDGGPWTSLFGGLSNNGAGGCNGTGNGYFCADSAGFGADHSGAGDPDTWVFLIDLTAPLGDTLTGNFKAHFVDANGNKVGDVLSENFSATLGGEFGPTSVPTAVPEPASLLLMGTGLSLVAMRLRRKRA